MMLTADQQGALFLDVHRAIEHAATEAVDALRVGGPERVITYPPNSGLTRAESDALRRLIVSDAAASGLRKLVASAAAQPLWTFFALVDAVGDPETYEGDWLPLELTPSENPEFLHDLFFETYWDWRKRRPDPGWKLDTYEGDVA